MLPLVLDLARLKVVVVGDGENALARLDRLEAAGAVNLVLYAPGPAQDLVRRAGSRLRRRLPGAEDLAAVRLVFISDRNAAWAPGLAGLARAAGALVHVEDAPALSDLHAPAVLRRGDLTIAVSTGGASPGLAAELKRFLGRVFGPEWGERLDRLGALRRHWRRSGVDAGTIAERTEAWIAQEEWLPRPNEVRRQALPERLATTH
jgi:precorrin-2 dehydrogenase / sirohydrochlorin ferrochelatase